MTESMAEGLLAEIVWIDGHGGDRINAYRAQPLGDARHPGVIVVHHMPGWDEATREITRRFADHGYIAICPNLHHREAPGALPDDAAAAARAAGGVPDERFVGDCGAALAHLRGLERCSGSVGVIGYCSGGRQAFLAACSLPLDAAVDCYGGFVVGAPPSGVASGAMPLLEKAAQLACPVLGLFGAEDSHPSPDEVRTLDTELTRLGKEHEFHSYPGAGHAFFASDRPSYRVEAALEGWRAVWDFFGRHLGN